MSERRKHPRIPVEHLMEARLSAGEHVAAGQVLDLNNAGAFIATALSLEKNDELQVELSVPGIADTLPLRAVVARRTEPIEGKNRVIPAGLGIVFLANNVMERAFIQKAVIQALRASLARTRSRLSAEAPRSSEVPPA